MSSSETVSLLFSSWRPSELLYEPLDQEISREGEIFTITITDSTPGPAEICTAIYRTYEMQITIGESLDSGQEYTVLVNDEGSTFTVR